MRTTIDLPDKLFRRVKAAASLRGVTLKEFISRSVEQQLNGSELAEEGQFVQLPLVSSEQPGSRDLTPERIAELLEDGDLHESSGR
ncbi:MAG TPA: hypothetical protein ENI06_02930 [Spirochaetales bacterium]|nr:hypothetical protein [Spirochaetales bacterium]